MDTILDKIIVQSLDTRGEMFPPWELHPELAQGSQGWRMGAGEAALRAWHRWLDRQSTRRVWRVQYFRRHAAPRTWTPVVVRALGDGMQGERHAIVKRERCVADDVAYAAWLRRGAKPSFGLLEGRTTSLRASAFWLRLARLRRHDAAWLATHDVLDEWQAILRVLHGGPIPDEPGLARIYGWLARDGTAPPPSVLGAPFDVRVVDSYAWAWARWMRHAFDDRATLTPHLVHATEEELAIARTTPAFAPHAAPYDPDPLAGLDEVEWEKFARPPWSATGEVASALRELADPEVESRAYYRLLDAIGNNHEGTYFPVVLPVLYFLARIVRQGSPAARLRTLDVLLDLVGSFAPDADHEEITLGPHRDSVKGHVTSRARELIADVKQLQRAPDSDEEAKLAAELLALLRE